MANIELKAFIGLHRALNHIDKEVSQVHNKYGLTMGQFAVLEALYNKGDMCVGQVQDKILSSSGTIAVIVKNLETRDLIEKSPDPGDKRKNILSLTGKGRELISRAYPENEEKILTLMGELSKEELDQLLNITKKLDKTYGGKEDGKTN